MKTLKVYIYIKKIYIYIFKLPRMSSPGCGGGRGLASLNDLTGYAGGNYMFLVGPSKPDRPKERSQTKRDKKINRFQRICGTIRKHLKKTRTDTPIKFCKVVARPTLLYGSEACVTTKRDMTRLEAAEMPFLRSITGYTRLDKIRSEVIRKELEISGIQDVRLKYKQNWINHLEGMDNTRLPKHALNYKPRGRRDRGRPRKRWQCVDDGTGQTT